MQPFIFDKPMEASDVKDYAYQHIDRYALGRLYRLLNVVIALLTLLSVALLTQAYYADLLLYKVVNVIVGLMVLAVVLYLGKLVSKTYKNRDPEYTVSQLTKDWQSYLGASYEKKVQLEKANIQIDGKAYGSVVQVVLAKQFALLETKKRDFVVKLDEKEHEACVAYLQQEAPEVRIELKNYMKDIAAKRRYEPK
ncbi:hypothetical protein A4S06_08120 [Erysipelotrichaceae bacterium MTC7]|nr:hypothetical protein A4S06_08120 [Erysipelotrichaceae bacterium MTC7]